jgi:hypothetical protein
MGEGLRTYFSSVGSIPIWQNPLRPQPGACQKGKLEEERGRRREREREGGRREGGEGGRYQTVCFP